jgi:hypothetical protein
MMFQMMKVMCNAFDVSNVKTKSMHVMKCFVATSVQTMRDYLTALAVRHS